jgi:pyruvate kinase
MKTKIIATIGPASLEYQVFSRLVDEGIDIVRINTSYGDPEQYDRIVGNVRRVSDRKQVKVMFDIKNPKVIATVLKYKPDMIAVSFAGTAQQISDAKIIIPEAEIIAKIESIQGIENFEVIAEASDGVMVARGDLADAISLEKVPCVQRELTDTALNKGKFLIIATEMLLSMTQSPKPSRAEVSDVANAVFNGASAVMLSEETAVGKYPAEAVSYMRRIIESSEACR